MNRYPLGPFQTGIYLDSIRFPGEAQYNMPLAVHITGALNLWALQKAFEALKFRHEILRSTVRSIAGEVMVEVNDVPQSPLDIDLDNIAPTPSKRVATRRRAVDYARWPFRLGTDELMRGALLAIAPDEHLLVLVVHHLACDPTSYGVLCDDLSQLYSGFSGSRHGATLPTIPSPREVLQEIQRRFPPERVKVLAEAHRTDMATIASEFVLRSDFPPSSSTSLAGATVTARIGPELLDRVDQFRRSRSCSMFMVLGAALSLALSAQFDASAVLLESTFSLRTDRMDTGVVGNFFNTFLVAVEVEPQLSLEQFLGKCRSSFVRAYGRRAVPRYLLRFGSNRLPELMVGFNYFDRPLGRLSLTGTRCQSISVDVGVSLSAILVTVERAPRGLRVTCRYRRDLFRQNSMRQLVHRFLRALNLIIEDSAYDVGESQLRIVHGEGDLR